MRILLVEDEPTLRAQLAQALQAAGYAVDEVDNGRDALHLGQTEPFDAVVLDLGLPQLDGLSVLRRWREEGHAMPVLILTARDHWHDKVAGIDAGADDYLTKPFHGEELLARLRALIRRASAWPRPRWCAGRWCWTRAAAASRCTATRWPSPATSTRCWPT